jgi:hypothetical protein
VRVRSIVGNTALCIPNGRNPLLVSLGYPLLAHNTVLVHAPMDATLVQECMRGWLQNMGASSRRA